MMRGSRLPAGRRLLWLPIVALGVLPLLTGDPYQLSVWTFILLGLIVVLGLDVLLGYGGQLSLGHGVFVTLGAYSSALLTTKLGWSGWVAMPCGMVVSALAALLIGIPALRLRGYYLAMATLGFPVVLDGVLRYFSAWTGGSSGVSGVPRLALGTLVLKEPSQVYWLAFVALCAVFFATERLVRSRFGLALKAVHADEAAAAARGIDVARAKVLAFVFSAVLASLSGSLYAHYVQFVAPDTFGIPYSIMLVVMLVVGGAGRLWGAIVGTVAMMWLPELLRAASTWEPIVFGIVLAVVMLFAPNGLAGLARRRPSIVLPAAGDAPHIDLPRPATPHASGLLLMDDVSRQFGGVRAVGGLSYQVLPGRVQALIGPNGAGKSTALALIAGTIPPSSGEIRFAGQRIEQWPAHRRARLGIGRTFQHVRLIPGLTVLENVLLGRYAAAGSGRHDDGVAAAAALVRQLGLEAVADAYPSEINQYQARLTEIGMALAGKPRLLLLDEPAAGLSSAEVDRLAQLLRGLRESGVAVVLVDHVMALVTASAEEILVLEYGNVIAQGTPGEVLRNEQVRAAYLGQGVPERGAVVAEDASNAPDAATLPAHLPVLQERVA